MALNEAMSTLRIGARPRIVQWLANAPQHPRHSSTASTEPAHAALPNLERASSFVEPIAGKELASKFDPAGWARQRKKELPSSRYKFRPPKYYRGPLHPHQPPRKTDPASREYSPGPFSLPRLEQTYDSTIAQDYMTLLYQHHPPGYKAPEKAQRLREWVGDSPYFKNRPLRGPRGGNVLLPLRKPVTFQNIPRITGVTVHSMVSDANEDSAYLHIASSIIQSITGHVCTTHQAKVSVQQWGAKRGKTVSLTSHITGEDAYNFVSKITDIVMPKIKEYKGVKGSSGDSVGNIAFGFTPEQVAYFPEIEFNYDQYPPRMIPGCHVTVHTTATTDYDSRLLLEAIGVPFYGKYVD